MKARANNVRPTRVVDNVVQPEHRVHSLLNRYRYDLSMWEEVGAEYRELYVNDNVFVWQRGTSALLVVVSGLGWQPSIPINGSNLIPGTNVCLMLKDETGVRAQTDACILN